MNVKSAKGIGIFLLAMFVFTFVSWKLDALQTPWVLCTQPQKGSVAGANYERIVPIEAVYENAAGCFVYIVETDSRSWFYPTAARRVSVTVLAKDETNAAVQGLYPEAQVVRFADRTLTGSASPVRVWEEEAA